MKIHEYQGKSILKRYNVPIQDGYIIDKIDSAKKTIQKVQDDFHTEDVIVMDPETMKPVPKDGKTMGEIRIKGNVVMKGYFKDKEATEKAMASGWFHSGDLAVMHPDGYIKIQDRSKDIIISGGENISSIEI